MVSESVKHNTIGNEIVWEIKVCLIEISDLSLQQFGRFGLLRISEDSTQLS